MIRSFIRRLLEIAVVAFALLGFVYVPLGGRTGYEHLRAIAETPAAERAVGGVRAAVNHLRAKLASALRPESTPRLPDLADSVEDASHKPKQPARSKAP